MKLDLFVLRHNMNKAPHINRFEDKQTMTDLDINMKTHG